MKVKDFKARLIDTVKNQKTLYVTGGWGQSLTANWQEYFIKNYSKNKDRADIIRAADGNTFAFDCVCFIKSVLDGFVADHSKTYGGATYGSPCPDISIKALLAQCSDVSTDMNNIKEGEFLVYKDYSHCGIYVGLIDNKRMAVECTYRWDDGVQLIDIDREERKGEWSYHGKLPYIDYTEETPSVKVDTTALKNMVTEKVKAKKGDKGDYVKEIQKVLIARGFPCGKTGADGDFGTNTQKAVKSFQTANSLTADGIVGYDTITRLIGE